MMRRLYDWMMRMAGHKKAPQALFWVAFIESSVFPIPPDVMLIPMILAQRAKAFLYATICTAARSSAASPATPSATISSTYIGEPILRVYGYGEKYQETADLFNEWGPWILIAKGWTPFPYKVLTIAAGAFKMSIVPFILATIVARAMRFYLVAALLYWFGEPIRDFIEKRLSLVTTAFVVLLVGGFVAIKYVL